MDNWNFLFLFLASLLVAIAFSNLVVGVLVFFISFVIVLIAEGVINL